MVSKAADVAKELHKQNISVRVVNMHTIKPIDKEIIIKAAKETKGIITAEEHNVIGGLGSAVSEVIAGQEQSLRVPVCHIGVQDVFGHSGSAEDCLKYYGLTSAHIVEEITAFTKTE